MNLILLFISLSMAFVLPGAAIAMRLQSRAKGAAAFIISSVLLFEVLLFLQISGRALSFWTVFSALGILSLFAFFYCAKSIRFKVPTLSMAPSSPLEVFLSIPVFLSTVILAFRAVLQPLSGYDTTFRWSWLGEEIFSTGTFSYYPPLSSADFVHYFYVDAIPPMCQFSYYWLYASLGEVSFSWTAVFTILQFLLILFFCFRLAEELADRTSAFFAVATLSTSVIFFWSVLMGQETGLTALSVAATLYFILTADEGDQRGAMAVAAFATTLGVLSREYGWAFLFCGLAAAHFKNIKRRHILLYVALVTALAAPWYLRTWILSGNPFYSNPVGHIFQVNAVHCALLRHYESVFSLTVEPLQKLDFLSFLVMSKSLLVVPSGILGLWVLRRHYWLHISLVVCGLAWLASVSHTAGGLFYSTRVLSPVFVLLSVASGAFLSKLQSRDWLIHSTIILVVGLISVTALLQEIIVPGHLETVQSKQWYREGFSSQAPNAWVPPLFEGIPPGSRCLSDWAGAWVAMRPRGVEIVPVWSPDAASIFDRGRSADEIVHTLREHNIRWVMVSLVVNLDHLKAQSPLYGALLQTRPWRISKSGKFALYSLADDNSALESF
ncbi:MAG: hypothetical protein DRJ61_13365 [Acidobacteria bacterium]|nr:MAG: hypothetical protein DRJ61_13365 [Acidobacteriota bacterium]